MEAFWPRIWGREQSLESELDLRALVREEG
jgi:hypothetical protein